MGGLKFGASALRVARCEQMPCADIERAFGRVAQVPNAGMLCWLAVVESVNELHSRSRCCMTRDSFTDILSYKSANTT